MAATKGEDSTRDVGDSTTSSVVPTNIRDLLWDDKSRTLRELISSYRLPLAVKLKTGDISKYFSENVSNHNTSKGTHATYAANSTSASCYSPSGASQMKFTASSDTTSALTSIGPEGKDADWRKNGQADVVLQIHETRRRKIILARKMTWDKRQNDYVVTGEQVEIPASIKGWLEVVPENGRPVEYYDTIGGITSTKPKRFLVRTSTVGYQLTTEENGNSCWMPQEIKAGEVLTTGIIYVDSNKNKNPAQRNIFKRILKHNKVKKEQELKYLQCFGSSGVEIMLPLIMTGVFSPVGDSSFANYDAVYEFQDLIMAFGLPVNAQLVHVNTKETFQCPRGVLRLYGTREEELAIVSKIRPDDDVFRDCSNVEKFEIPLDKDILFSRGILAKKTNVDSTQVNKLSSPYEQKNVSKSRPEGGEIKSKVYVMEISLDKSIESSNQRVPTPLSDKSKPPTISYNANTPALGVYTDMNRKNGSQQSTIVTKEMSSSLGIISSDPNTQEPSTPLDSPLSQEQTPSMAVELPEKAPKEVKSRSSSILEKLSVRKVKKERAKLKELRSDDVFSKRISRSGLSYQDFYNGLDNDSEVPKNSDYGKLKQDDSGRGSSGGTYQSSSSSNSNGTYSVTTPSTPSNSSSKSANDIGKIIQRRPSMLKRDLPPIPLDSPRGSGHVSPIDSINLSKESLYEHLPLAPQPPPYFRRASESAILDSIHNDNVFVDPKDDEEGYMLPRQVQQDTRYVKRSDVQLRQKSAGLSKDSLKNTRARKTRSGLPDEFVQKTGGYDSSCPLDIDDLFNFTYNSKELGQNRPLGTNGSAAVSTSQLYGTAKVNEWRSQITDHLVNSDQKFVDNLDLETNGSHHVSRNMSRHSKALNVNPNATIRSHNLRKFRPSAKEVFPFQDSRTTQSAFDDFRNSYMQNSSDQQNAFTHNSRPQLYGSHSIDTTMMTQQFQQPYQHQHLQNLRGANYGMHYAESEPCFHFNNRVLSVGGIGDAFFKQGDDSAISMCSRGEAGFPNESEYSYNVYLENIRAPDDGWAPPDQIEGLSVHEVSKSLRYIGMKDRVVLRFSREQIDGSMLCTLDEKLLKEGFPELNALEVKKIVDFIRGWRPKKS